MVKRSHANGAKLQTQTTNANNKRKQQAQAPNASTKRKHQTQALMGATRLASGKDAAIIFSVRIPLLSLFRRGDEVAEKFSDARRVAPIRV